MHMNNELSATGIVISAMPVGEYDKRVIILTKELGKVHAFARGARRQNSPLMAPSEPFTYGRFFLREGRDAYTLTGVKAKNYFMELREDLDLLYLGYYFLEVADFFGQDGLEATEEIKLLYFSFLAIAKKSEALPARLIKCVFEWKMLAIEGYLAAELPEDEREGLTDSALYAIRYIIETKPEKLYTFTVTAEVLAEMERAIGRYKTRYMNGHFKSLDLIENT